MTGRFIPVMQAAALLSFSAGYILLKTKTYITSAFSVRERSGRKRRCFGVNASVQQPLLRPELNVLTFL